MMTPLHFSSAYCYSSDSMEKPAPMEQPPDLPPLDIDDLPPNPHDPVPPSANDHVRLDFMVRMGSLGFPQMKSPIPIAINIILYSS